jgi:hypothetical protein
MMMRRRRKLKHFNMIQKDKRYMVVKICKHVFDVSAHVPALIVNAQ